MLKIRKKMGKKGLTLIELLVTIAVLAVVAAIAVPVVGNVINNANEQAVAQTETDIANFTEKYSKSGGYTYDPSTGTFAGYADLNGDGVATEDEKIEEFDVDLDKFSVGSVGGDVPTSAAEIDFGNPVATNFNIIDYAVTISPESLTVNGWVNNAISATNVSLDGAQGTITWTISEGTLPTGLTLNPSTGIVTGTPTETYTLDTVVIQATDENGAEVTQSHSYDIAPEPTLTPASVTTDGLVGESLSTANASLNGFTEPYSWEITSGSLPTGLNLNTSTGTISGTPTEVGTSGLTIMLTDTNGLTANQTHEFTIEASALYEFTNATFTPGGSSGPTGPTTAQARSGAGNPSWANQYINTNNGYISWTVPEDATYEFTVDGATGGRVSSSYSIPRGARVSGRVSLTEGEIITMVVGQQGGNSDTYKNNPGGGGGSFVTRGTYNSVTNQTDTLLFVAGGGGGVAAGDRSNLFDDAIGQAGESGGTGASSPAGTNGNGANRSSTSNSSGGAGYFTNTGQRTDSNFGGAVSSSGTISYGFRKGALGAGGQDYFGGFGGGGKGSASNSRDNDKGGGGGYSGGGYSFDADEYAGGGGSFIVNSASNTSATAGGATQDNGKIVITKID